MISIGGAEVPGFAVGDAPCPSNPPPPAGYVVWRGPVPPELTQWAIVLRDGITRPPAYGRTWTMSWNGSQVLARLDVHTWTYRRQPDGSAKLVTGICIPGVTIYRTRAAAVGLHAAEVTDPATAAPDPDLALYPAREPAERRTDWGLVAATALAAGLVVGGFAWGVHAAGTGVR